MRSNSTHGRFIEPLEDRRLLALNAFGNPVKVSVTGGTPTSSASAVGGNGTYIVAQQEAAKKVAQVTAVRYSAAGQRIGAPIIIAKGKNGFDSRVAVSMNASGDSVIAYTIGANGTLPEGLYVTLLSHTGTLGAPIAIATGTTLSGEALNSAQAVSMDDAGRFFIAWTVAGGNGEIKVRSYDALAKPRASAFTIHPDHDSVLAYDLQIAAKPDGSGAVLAYPSADSSSALYFNRVTKTASATSKSESFIAGGSELRDPTVSVKADGSFLLGYSLGGDNSSTVAVQAFNKSGKTVGEAIDVGDTITGFKSMPGLALLSNDGFAASFMLAGDDRNVAYVRQYAANNVPDPSGAVEIASSPFLNNIDLGADKNGALIATYFVPDLATGISPTFYRRLTPDIAAIDQSVLYVFGADDPANGDAIGVKTKASNVIVNRGDTIKSFDAAQVKKINISGLAGNDSIGNYTALPSTINGGNGNDTLRGGSSTDLLIGAKGKDKMYGYAGIDTFAAKDSARDTLDGGDALDIVSSKDSVDTLRDI